MTQDNRIIKIKTQLDQQKIQLRSFQGHEEISRLFRFELDFINIDEGFKHKELVDKLVGQNVTLTVETGKSPRPFNGHISQVTVDYQEDTGIVYRADMVPWLWFLTKTSDCRIFQNMKTPDIISKIFDDLGFKDYELKLNNEYREWEYCVQYRETDFNFVSRLMEQEGVFYYFKHEDGKHTLCLRDDADGYYDLPEKEVPYPLSRQRSRSVGDHIHSWERRFQFETGAWAQTDYNFKTPSSSLMNNTTTNVGPKSAQKFEIYDYPGTFIEKSVGKRETEYRIEEEEVGHDVAIGGSSCKSFSPGGKFKLTEHPNSEEKGGTYVITSIRHSASDSSNRAGGSEYSNTFTCIPDKVVFRPARVTPKPVISGIQTAVVVGPKGEEIYTDEYGRVKVQFHWDREGKRDENSSCFIRCSQNVAGKKWGFMAIPRIGQEVVVDFLEGDPDQPLIVGGVYNDEQMPHYDPVEHAAKTYIKTNTTKGGEGFNELFFDDKKDGERVFVHAQKDMDKRVLNDTREHIHGDLHRTIGTGFDEKTDFGSKGSYRELIWRHKALTIKKHQHEHIHGSYGLTVGHGDLGEADSPGLFHVVIERQKSQEIGPDGYHLTVEGDHNTKVGGSKSVGVGGDQMVSVGGANHLSVTADHNEKIGGQKSLDVASSYDQKVGSKAAVDAGQEIHLKAGMKVIIEAGAQISLVGPGGFVDIGPAGVTIQGVMVKINSGGSAGSGSGASPTAPTGPTEPDPASKATPFEPNEAHNEKTGYKSAPD